jgi:hypothetical protein
LAYAVFDYIVPIFLANVARKVMSGPTGAWLLGYLVLSSPTQGSSPTASKDLPDNSSRRAAGKSQLIDTLTLAFCCSGVSQEATSERSEQWSQSLMPLSAATHG